MSWWDALTLLSVSSGAIVGMMGAVLALVRQLPWGRGWYGGGYP